MPDCFEQPLVRAAVDHMLGLLIALPWSDMLVLRGSRLMLT